MNTIDLNAYTVVTAKNGKTYWNKLGAAFQFETADGRTGFNIPNLNIVVIQPKEELDETEGAVITEIPTTV